MVSWVCGLGRRGMLVWFCSLRSGSLSLEIWVLGFEDGDEMLKMGYFSSGF